jgi:hypothetical protein
MAVTVVAGIKFQKKISEGKKKTFEMGWSGAMRESSG